MSFCDWIFVICNFSRPSQGKFVICNWNLLHGGARAPIVHDDQGTYHQHCSEFSQDPQEFREKGAVSPFAKLNSGVRKMKVNKQDADELQKKLPRNPRREHSWFVICDIL